MPNQDVFSVGFSHLKIRNHKHPVTIFLYTWHRSVFHDFLCPTSPQKLAKTCAQEGFQIGSTCAKFTGEMRFLLGKSLGQRATGTQTNRHTNSPCQKYIWDPLQEIHTHKHSWSHQSIVVLVLGCIVCVYYTTYIAYMMHTHNMHMTIILLGMHVCFVYGEDQRCPHPCMRIVPFL